MKKNLAISFSLLVAGPSIADGYQFRIEAQKNAAETKLVAINSGFAPVTASIDISSLADERKNVKAEDLQPASRKVVLAPRSQTTILTFHPSNPGQPYSVRYSTRWFFGDDSARHDIHAAYRLPYPDGVAAKTARNLDPMHGGLGHQFDIDFVLKEWTPVLAARPGLVFDVHGYTEGDPTYTGTVPSGSPEEADNHGDYVKVLHEDGSYAEYSNLMEASVMLKPGQEVKEGQQIAFSGDSTRTGTPHLHFGIYTLVPFQGIQSAPWFLKTKHVQMLRPDEGALYKADYSLADEPEKALTVPEQSTKQRELPEIFKSTLRKSSEGGREGDQASTTPPRGQGAGKDARAFWVWIALAAATVVALYVQWRKRSSNGNPRD